MVDVLSALTKWKKGGKDELIRHINSLLEDEEKNAIPLTSVVYALFKSASYQEISFDIVEDFFKSIDSQSIQTLSIDTIWTLDMELESLRDQRTLLINIVKALVRKQLIPELTAKERLDIAFLEAVGLISDQNIFQKRTIRVNTALLYKQQKYNLMREESEGFSKLVTTILEDMIQSKKHMSNKDNMNAFARESMDKIRALIGYFDLDPNRVLDIIIDIFSMNIVEYFDFFLKLLQASPWNRHKVTAVGAEDILQTKLEDEHDGSNICAQILGFKFSYYQQPNITDDVPNELYLLAALLIKEKFIRLADLYPHLSPSDSEMQNELLRFKNDMSDLAMKAKSNALSMAAPLSDDGPTMANTPIQSAEQAANVDEKPTKRLPIQKAGLLKALLALGDIQHAIFIMSRFYWISGPHPQVADLICRLLHKSFESVYAPLRLNSKLSPDVMQRITTIKSRRHPPFIPEQQIVLTGEAILPASTVTTKYEFFYPNWTDQIPLCSTFEDVLNVLQQFFKFVGMRIYRDVSLVAKLCRIGVAHVRSSQKDSHVMKSWMDIMRQYLLPALSQMHANPGIAHELWELLHCYPYEMRYALYGEWKESIYKIYPEMKVKKTETERESKGILRRISKDNVKQFGRMLAKLSHSNPSILFTVALEQIQAYDNLVGPIVDAAKYLTQFGYDVLPYVILESLSNPVKNRIKQDGTNASLWLASLASFTGTLLKKYSNMDPTTIVQYVANQLKANNTKDLIVLNKLITTMGGIDAGLHLSDLQLACLSGGEILKAELLASLNPNEKRANVKRSSSRLLKCLIDSDLAIAILILTAQQMQVCVFNVSEEESHLKALGSLYDTAHDVFVQYVDFLVTNLGWEKYSQLVPSLETLCKELGLETVVAFHITRTVFAQLIRKYEDEATEKRLRESARLKIEENAKLAAADDNGSTKENGLVNDVDINGMHGKSSENGNSAAQVTGDVVMATETEEVEPRSQEMNSDEAAQKDSNKMDVVMNTEPNEKDSRSQEKNVAGSPQKNSEKMDVVDQVEKVSYHPALQPFLESVNKIIPESSNAVLSPEFYLTFWQLGLGDISVPTKGYMSLIDSCHAKIRELDAEHDRSPTAVTKRKRDKEKIMQTIASLNAELKKQVSVYEVTLKRLRQEKLMWFDTESSSNSYRNELVNEFLEKCIQPRVLFSENDAIYTAKFIRLLHSMATPNFSTLTLYDRIFNDYIAPMFFSLTEGEANNYSRFLKEILADLSAWHKDEEVYNKDGHGKNLPGLAKKWGNNPFIEPVPDESMLNYEEFRHVYYKWQRRIFTVFKVCFDSKEFMHMRNAIIVLTRIAPFFPAVNLLGQKLSDIMSDIIARETRDDLKLLATGYKAILSKHKSKWVASWQFHDDPVAKQNALSAAAKPKTPVATPAAPPNATSSIIFEASGSPAAPNTSLPPKPNLQAWSPRVTGRSTNMNIDANVSKNLPLPNPTVSVLKDNIQSEAAKGPTSSLAGRGDRDVMARRPELSPRDTSIGRSRDEIGRSSPIEGRVVSHRDRRDRERDRIRSPPRGPAMGNKRSREPSPDRRFDRSRDERDRRRDGDRDRRSSVLNSRDRDRDRDVRRESSRGFSGRDASRDAPADGDQHKRRREDFARGVDGYGENLNGHEEKRRRTDASKADSKQSAGHSGNSTPNRDSALADESKKRSLSDRLGKEIDQDRRNYLAHKPGNSTNTGNGLDSKRGGRISRNDSGSQVNSGNLREDPKSSASRERSGRGMRREEREDGREDRMSSSRHGGSRELPSRHRNGALRRR